MIDILLAALILWVFSYVFVTVDDIADWVITKIEYSCAKRKKVLLNETRKKDIQTRLQNLKNKKIKSVWDLIFTNGRIAHLEEILDRNYEFIDKYDVRQFKTSEELIDSLKNSPARDFYLHIYRFFNNIKEFPVEFYYDVKYFIQRGIYGWSFRDVWSIDWFLAEIIPPMIKRLKETGHGYPTWLEGMTEEEAKKEWHDVLDSIYLTFMIARMIQRHHWYYQDSKKFDKKLYKQTKESNLSMKLKEPNLWNEYDLYVMNKEECKVYEKGWRNFRKWFYNLWD